MSDAAVTSASALFADAPSALADRSTSLIVTRTGSIQDHSDLPRADIRLRGATYAGRTMALASRVLGQGSGVSNQGQVMLRLDPIALDKLLRGRRNTIVSGTNGKTTTTHFLSAAAAAAYGARTVATNADGANLNAGIVSALSNEPKASLTVLETDERVVADMIDIGRPEVAVLLNFSRDQLDRNHEVKRLAADWRTALGKAGPQAPVVIANSRDPLIVWVARDVARVIWVDAAAAWTQDAALCPRCQASLCYYEDQSSGTDDHWGGQRWSCVECDLAQPRADYRVRGQLIIDPQGNSWQSQLRVPGRFNVGNAACALAAAVELGIDVETALRGIRTVTAPAGRFATVRFGDVTARLILAKNPAGWAKALPLAQTETVILGIDSAAADGRDVSWLWDIDYGQLRGRRVIVTGPRAQDLAVRLSCVGVDYVCVPELAAAVRGHRSPVDIFATYTPFQQLRRMGRV